MDVTVTAPMHLLQCLPVLLFHSSVTANSRYHEILWLCLQSACPSGWTSHCTNCVHWAKNNCWCLQQCGNCFLRLCQFENRFNPTMSPCAAKYYADIWPCYKDHYKQYDVLSTCSYCQCASFNFKHNQKQFHSSFQILSARYACLQLTLTSACHHE